MSILSGLRSRAQDYREPDSIGPVLAEAVAEIESLRADRDERARQKSELLAEIERLLDTIKAMTREREAARAWLRGELSGSRLGDPAPDRIACMWCGEICYGGREIAKQHVQECSKNPLVQRIRELERRSRNDCPER
jgi:hypothetical protein